MSNLARALLRRVVEPLLSRFGLSLVRERRDITMPAAVAAIADRNHGIRTVVDIGASNGSWSAMAMKVLPPCDYFLIEAQKFHRSSLESFCRQHANAQFVLAAAGERKGEIYFDTSDPLGGRASNLPHAANNEVLPTITIDEEVEDRRLQGPFLLKFDTHGFEVPILLGAERTLGHTAVIVMECYNYRISPECLLFDEMCSHLKLYGFRCIDLVEPLHRPFDNTFWQMDIVFAKESRPEFQYNAYD